MNRKKTINHDAPTARWRVRLKAFVIRAAIMGTLWWIMSEGLRFDGMLPVLAIAVATLSSMIFWTPGAWRWRVGGFVCFVPYFFRQSFLGGIDVSRRALHPSLPLRPGLVEYPLRLRLSVAQVFFVWIVTLLPGTAVARLQINQVTIHTLDCTDPLLTERLHELEKRVAALFGIELPK